MVAKRSHRVFRLTVVVQLKICSLEMSLLRGLLYTTLPLSLPPRRRQRRLIYSGCFTWILSSAHLLNGASSCTDAIIKICPFCMYVVRGTTVVGRSQSSTELIKGSPAIFARNALASGAANNDSHLSSAETVHFCFG